MGREMVSHVRDNNLLGMQIVVSLQFDGSWGPTGKLENFKTVHISLIVAAVLPIRRKYLSNQSIIENLIKHSLPNAAAVAQWVRAFKP